MMVSSEITAELDAVRAKVREALASRDLDRYLDVFSPQLQYTQPDGNTISRDQLARDVRKQFRAMRRADSTMDVVSATMSDNRIVETVTQNASIDIAIFFFFTKRWYIKRTGEYQWEKAPDGWKVVRVIVFEEHVSGSAPKQG